VRRSISFSKHPIFWVCKAIHNKLLNTHNFTWESLISLYPTQVETCWNFSECFQYELFI
jgi:hypothetical protein